MNSIIYGIGNKHSRKNETKSKKTECRGWDSGWGYCSRMQKVTKQKKKTPKTTRNQTLLALLLPEPA